MNHLPQRSTPIFDVHCHIWDAGAFSELEKWANIYSVKKFMGIAQPDVRKSLEEMGKSSTIIFAYYLPMQAFAEQDPKKIIDAVDEAYSLGYSMVKMWFGPRFLDYFKASKPFSISDPIFDPVFTLIENYGIPMDVHVADPDTWYSTKYTNIKLYRTKSQAIKEFTTVLKRHPSLKLINIHFGSLPEDLKLLGEILERFPNMNIDTASTKWIIRELGKNPEETHNFIINHQDRIMFGSDLSCGWGDRTDDYYATRYWSQRLFWETKVNQVELPFSDDDNASSTVINGIGLPNSILERLYWKNAENFFSKAT